MFVNSFDKLSGSRETFQAKTPNIYEPVHKISVLTACTEMKVWMYIKAKTKRLTFGCVAYISMGVYWGHLRIFVVYGNLVC